VQDPGPRLGNTQYILPGIPKAFREANIGLTGQPVRHENVEHDNGDEVTDHDNGGGDGSNLGRVETMDRLRSHVATSR
jgi:hypothetical protein